MNTEKNYISTNLKFLRKAHNKTLVEIGKLCNKSDIAVHHWESGYRVPYAVDIVKLCNYYGVTMDQMINTNLSLSISKECDELSTLFNKYKNILTGSDISLITTIIENRIRENEKQ